MRQQRNLFLIRRNTISNSSIGEKRKTSQVLFLIYDYEAGYLGSLVTWEANVLVLEATKS